MNIEFKNNTPNKIKKLVNKLLDIFESIGIPLDATDRSLERMAKACLAVGQIKHSFAEAISASNKIFMRSRDVIDFENKYYGENISPGSYDDIRRKDLKVLVEAGVVVNSSSTNIQSTNNQLRGYALSPIFADLLHNYDCPTWEKKLSDYIANQKSLKEEFRRLRDLDKIPVILPNGITLKLGKGEHNNLQKSIIEEFLPRYGFGASVLYIGDTDDKLLYLDKDSLDDIKFFELKHEELPDIIAYSKEKNLLYLIEAFHSTGEWNELRLRLIKQKLIDSGCTATPIYFTAFENKNSFRLKSKDIAWETEVWIADNPDHLIHFNGYKFLEIHG